MGFAGTPRITAQLGDALLFLFVSLTTEMMMDVKQFLAQIERMMQDCQRIGMSEEFTAMAFAMGIAALIEQRDSAISLINVTYDKVAQQSYGGDA